MYLRYADAAPERSPRNQLPQRCSHASKTPREHAAQQCLARLSNLQQVSLRARAACRPPPHDLHEQQLSVDSCPCHQATKRSRPHREASRPYGHGRWRMPTKKGCDRRRHGSRVPRCVPAAQLQVAGAHVPRRRLMGCGHRGGHMRPRAGPLQSVHEMHWHLHAHKRAANLSRALARRSKRAHWPPQHRVRVAHPPRLAPS
mmetsp:Transcript_63874/g.106212  ORF Transcript_63874/g.106212 Transcript_63874/m.106212 type:complete len:201 (+) Transcript_63874:1601-2203(+)